MYCKKCGNLLEGSEAFCPRCGTAVAQGAPAQAGVTEVMTVWQYLLTFLIAAIPIVGIVVMFVWAFSQDINPNRRNLARSILIAAAVVVGLRLLLLMLGLVAGAVFGGLIHMAGHAL